MHWREIKIYILGKRKWKLCWMTMELEYTKIDIPKPTTLDAQQLVQWKKDIAKARRIILEGVRDHVVSNLHGNEIYFEIWKNFTDLFESNNDAMNLALKYKLRNIGMNKIKTIV